MKMKKILSALIALSMVPTVAIPSAFAAQGKRYDFNDVVTTTEKYFPSLNINTDAANANMTYEQATFDGAQVLKSTMNAQNGGREVYTWENIPDMDKVVIQVKMGIDGAGNDAANLPRHMGIRPIFNKEDGSKGWNSSCLGNGIRIEQSRYWQIEGANPNQAPGKDGNDADSLPDSQLGYRIEDGKLYEAGYVYDRTNKLYKAYVITNNGEVIVRDVSADVSFVQEQRYLSGVTLYTRSDNTYKTGKAYYDYLYIDEAEALSAKTTPANGETKVSTEENLTLNFNYVLDPAVSPVVTLVTADGQTVDANVTVNNGKTVTVDPVASLAMNKSYKLTVQAKDLLGQIANVVVDFATGKNLASIHYDFNDVVTTTGKYFPSLNINADAANANMTYEQATFDGEKVLKSTMNAQNSGREAYTWESIPDMDKVIVRARIGINGEGNETANLPRHFGIRPIFNKADGNKGWESGGANLANGIRIEQSRYWQIEGWNPHQAAGGDLNKDGVADTQLGYRIEDGKLYEVGYVYDRTNKIYKAYVITNNGEVVVKDNSSFNYVQQQRYLGGVTLYTRSDATYKTGKGYYDYLYIDEADDFVVESSSVKNGAEGIAVNGEFKLDYNYVIDPASLGTAVFTAEDGSTVAGTVAVKDGRTLTVTPASDLKGNTNYTLTVSGTKDLLGQSAKAEISFKTVSSTVSMHYDFNDVVTTSEKYFPTYNMNTDAANGNVTYSQGTFDGAKVLKAQMNASKGTEANTWEAIPDADRLVIQARMGVDAEGNAAANLQRHMGIRPIFNTADGKKGWESGGKNLGEGIRIENNHAWRIEDWNPKAAAGTDTLSGYSIEDGKLYDVGYVYDRVNKVFKAYVITNNGETIVKDDSADTRVQEQRYLGGITIYSRSNATDYNTGKGYYDYLYIDEAEDFVMESSSVEDNTAEFTYNYVIDPANAGSAVFTAKDGKTVQGTVSTFNGKTLVVKPVSALAGETEYTLTVKGTKDLLGQTAADANISFTTEPVVPTENVIYSYDFDSITAVNEIGANCNPVTNDDVNGEQRGVGTFMSVSDTIANSGKSLKLDGTLSADADTFIKNQQTYKGEGKEFIELSADYYFEDLGTKHYVKLPEVKMATADGAGSWNVCELQVNFDGTIADENKVLTGKKIEEGKWYNIKVRINSIDDTVTYYVDGEEVVSGNYAGSIDITGLATIQVVQSRQSDSIFYVDNWKLSTWNIFDEVEQNGTLDTIEYIYDDAEYTVAEDGTVTTIARMAIMDGEKTVTVYTASYDASGRFVDAELDTVALTAGVVEWANVPAIENAETLKTFWFSGMEPVR